MAAKTVKEILTRAITDAEFRKKLLNRATTTEALKNYEKKLTVEETACLLELNPERLEEFSTSTDIRAGSDIRI